MSTPGVTTAAGDLEDVIRQAASPRARPRVPAHLQPAKADEDALNSSAYYQNMSSKSLHTELFYLMLDDAEADVSRDELSDLRADFDSLISKFIACEGNVALMQGGATADENAGELDLASTGAPSATSSAEAAQLVFTPMLERLAGISKRGCADEHQKLAMYMGDEINRAKGAVWASRSERISSMTVRRLQDSTRGETDDTVQHRRLLNNKRNVVSGAPEYLDHLKLMAKELRLVPSGGFRQRIMQNRLINVVRQVELLHGIGKFMLAVVGLATKSRLDTFVSLLRREGEVAIPKSNIDRTGAPILEMPRPVERQPRAVAERVSEEEFAHPGVSPSRHGRSGTLLSSDDPALRKASSGVEPRSALGVHILPTQFPDLRYKMRAFFVSPVVTLSNLRLLLFDPNMFPDLPPELYNVLRRSEDLPATQPAMATYWEARLIATALGATVATAHECNCDPLPPSELAEFQWIERNPWEVFTGNEEAPKVAPPPEPMLPCWAAGDVCQSYGVLVNTLDEQGVVVNPDPAKYSLCAFRISLNLTSRDGRPMELDTVFNSSKTTAATRIGGLHNGGRPVVDDEVRQQELREVRKKRRALKRKNSRQNWELRKVEVEPHPNDPFQDDDNGNTRADDNEAENSSDDGPDSEEVLEQAEEVACHENKKSTWHRMEPKTLADFNDLLALKSAGMVEVFALLGRPENCSGSLVFYYRHGVQLQMSGDPLTGVVERIWVFPKPLASTGFGAFRAIGAVEEQFASMAEAIRQSHYERAVEDAVAAGRKAKHVKMPPPLDWQSLDMLELRL